MGGGLLDQTNESWIQSVLTNQRTEHLTNHRRNSIHNNISSADSIKETSFVNIIIIFEEETIQETVTFPFTKSNKVVSVEENQIHHIIKQQPYVY